MQRRVHHSSYHAPQQETLQIVPQPPEKWRQVAAYRLFGFKQTPHRLLAQRFHQPCHDAAVELGGLAVVIGY